MYIKRNLEINILLEIHASAVSQWLSVLEIKQRSWHLFSVHSFTFWVLKRPKFESVGNKKVFEKRWQQVCHIKSHYLLAEYCYNQQPKFQGCRSTFQKLVG
jgi:hypothetical protein